MVHKLLHMDHRRRHHHHLVLEAQDIGVERPVAIHHHRVEEDIRINHTDPILHHQLRMVGIQVFHQRQEAVHHPQGKKERSTVLNACRAKEFVVQSTLTRCMTRAALFLKNVLGIFFNATNQAKAIAIAIIEENPLVEIGGLL